MQKLSVKGLGTAIALLWGGANFITGFAAMAGWGGAYVEVLGSLYVGYEASPLGALIGLVWSLIDGFIGGALLAWLYNLFAARASE